MKTSAVLVLAAFVMSTSIPVFAADKDECMMASMKCKAEADSIQQNIKKLNAEIKEGKKSYSVEELNKLRDKLADANQLLTDMTKGGH